MKKLLIIITALAMILSLGTVGGFAANTDKTEPENTGEPKEASISADAKELRDFTAKCIELIDCSDEKKDTLFDNAIRLFGRNIDTIRLAKSRLKYKLVLYNSRNLNIPCNFCHVSNTTVPVFDGDETLENMYCLCENCGHKFKYLEYCADCYTEDVMKPICCNDPLKYDESKSYTFALCTSCGSLRRMMDCEHDCGDSCEYEQYDYEEVISASAKAIMNKRKCEILSYLMIFDLSDETRDYLLNQ